MIIKFAMITGALFYAMSSTAASLSDPVIETPKGTVFELKREMDIPANRNFIVLGKNQLSETFNEINQVYNQQNNNYAYQNPYYHYDDYLYDWNESVSQSYQNCLEKHRRFYSYNPDSNSNNTIINQGQNNTNIIINNSSSKSYSGSYIAENTCIEPNHTFSALIIDEEEAGSGGIFRKGYKFKVKSVYERIRNGLYTIDIKFDHKVAKGIRVVTNQSPDKIKIFQLNAQKSSGSGFWESLGSAVSGLTNIGGNYFKISLPRKKYYE